MNVFSSWRRRKWPVLAIVSLGMAITLALVASWPSYYRSTATITAEEYLDADALGGASATDYAARRLLQLRAGVDTEENFARAVSAADALLEHKETAASVTAPASVRSRLSVNLVGADLQRAEGNGPGKVLWKYTVSYRDSHPEIARQVTDTLSGIYIAAHRQFLVERSAQQQARVAQDEGRLREELRALGAQLEDLGSRAKGLNSKGADVAAAQSAEVARRLAAARSSLDEALRSAADLEEQQNGLQRALQNLPPVAVETREEKVTVNYDARKKELSAELDAATARFGADHPDVRKIRKSLDTINERIRQRDATQGRSADLLELRKTLARMRKTKPADDPDLIMMTQLEKRFETEIAAQSPQLIETRMVEIKRPNPDYQSQESNLRAVRDQRKMAVETANSLRESITSMEAELVRLESVGQEQQDINQTQQSLQGRYDVVAAQLKQIEHMSQAVQHGQEGAVSLTGPARSAAYSEKSRSYLVLIIGVLASCALGILYLWVKDRADTTVRSAAALRQLTGSLRPVAIMPYIVTEQELRHNRMRSVVNYAFLVAGWMLIVLAVGYTRQPLNEVLARMF